MNVCLNNAYQSSDSGVLTVLEAFLVWLFLCVFISLFPGIDQRFFRRLHIFISCFVPLARCGTVLLPSRESIFHLNVKRPDNYLLALRNTAHPEQNGWDYPGAPFLHGSPKTTENTSSICLDLLELCYLFIINADEKETSPTVLKWEMASNSCSAHLSTSTQITKPAPRNHHGWL